MRSKKVLLAAGVLAGVMLTANSGQAGTFKGKVTDSLSLTVVSGATVLVKGTTTQTTTNRQGTFSLAYTPQSIQLWSASASEGGVRFLSDQRRIIWNNVSLTTVRLYTIQGRVLDVYRPTATAGSYRLPALGAGVYLITLSGAAGEVTCHLVMAGPTPLVSMVNSLDAQGQPKSAANTVTLVFSFSNYTTREQDVVMFDTSIAVLLKPSGNFPDSFSTGYTAGTVLTPTSGRTISTNNTVVKNEKITGGLTLAGQNDTVRNCWITSYFGKGEAVNGTGVVTVLGTAVIDHCTLDGQLGTHAGLWYQGTNVVIRNCNIFNINDGVFCWDADNFTMEDNYLHDFTTETANGHIDGFQTEGASHGIIRHNTIEVSQDQNACVSIWDGRRNSDDILVDNNYLAGSGYAVYVEDYSPSEASPAGGYSVTNIRLTNNMFSEKYYRCIGYYGTWYPRGNPTDAWNRSGNTVIETGVNVDNGQPPGCF